MISCEAVRADLKAFLDGELSALTRVGVRRHLEQCAACRAEMAAMERIGRELRALETAAPRPELRARILAQLPETPPAAARKRPVGRWRSGWPTLAFAGSAAALALLVAMFRVEPDSVLPPPTPSQPSAPAAAPPQAAGSKERRSVASSTERLEAPTNGSAGASLARKPAPPGTARSRTSMTSRPAAKKMPSNPAPATSQFNDRLSPGKPMTQAGREAVPALSAGAATAQDGAAQTAKRPAGEQAAGRRFFSVQGEEADNKNRAAAGAAAPGDPAPLPEGDSARKSDMRSLAYSVNPSAPQADQPLVLFVDSVETRKSELEKVALKAGGYVERVQLKQEQDGSKSASLILRVPPDKVESLKAQFYRYNLTADTANSMDALAQYGATLKMEDKAVSALRGGLGGGVRAQQEPSRSQEDRQALPQAPGQSGRDDSLRERNAQQRPPGSQSPAPAKREPPETRSPRREQSVQPSQESLQRRLNRQRQTPLIRITIQLREAPVPAQSKPLPPKER